MTAGQEKPHPRKHTEQLGFLDFDIRLHRIDDHVWFRGSAGGSSPAPLDSPPKKILKGYFSIVN